MTMTTYYLMQYLHSDDPESIMGRGESNHPVQHLPSHAHAWLSACGKDGWTAEIHRLERTDAHRLWRISGILCHYISKIY